jgi:hypothetical protein
LFLGFGHSYRRTSFNFRTTKHPVSPPVQGGWQLGCVMFGDRPHPELLFRVHFRSIRGMPCIWGISSGIQLWGSTHNYTGHSVCEATVTWFYDSPEYLNKANRVRKVKKRHYGRFCPKTPFKYPILWKNRSPFWAGKQAQFEVRLNTQIKKRRLFLPTDCLNCSGISCLKKGAVLYPLFKTLNTLQYLCVQWSHAP